MKHFCCLLILILTLSCNKKKPVNGKWEIETNLIKGSIDANGTTLNEKSSSVLDVETKRSYYLSSLQGEGFEIEIDTTFKNFEDYLNTHILPSQKDNGSIYSEQEIKQDSYLYFRKYISNKGSYEGYEFIVYKKGEKKNYILKGMRDLYNYKPIYDKETLLKAMEIANSFIPGD